MGVWLVDSEDIVNDERQGGSCKGFEGEYYNESALVGIYASVHAVLALAEVGALHIGVVALAVLLEAIGLTALAASLIGQLRSVSTDNFQAVHEGIWVSFEHDPSRFLSFIVKLVVVPAGHARTLTVAHHTIGEAFAVHQQALGLGAFARYFLGQCWLLRLQQSTLPLFYLETFAYRHRLFLQASRTTNGVLVSHLPEGRDAGNVP